MVFSLVAAVAAAEDAEAQEMRCLDGAADSHIFGFAVPQPHSEHFAPVDW
jgi:MoxR-like ATPase